MRLDVGFDAFWYDATGEKEVSRGRVGDRMGALFVAAAARA